MLVVVALIVDSYEETRIMAMIAMEVEAPRLYIVEDQPKYSW